MPLVHFLDNAIGHLRNQRGTDFGSIDLLQMFLDLPRTHSSRIHRQNLVVESIKSPLMFTHDLWLECAFSIARNFNVDLAKIASQCLLAFSIAGVAGTTPGRITFLVA